MKRQLLALSASAALLLCGCGEAAAPALTAQITAQYDTAQAERVTLRRQTVYDAYVCAETEALSFAVAGTVSELYASPGDTVTAGQLLCVLDTKSVDDSIADAQKSIDAAAEAYSFSRGQLALSIREQQAQMDAALDGKTQAELTAAIAAAGAELGALEQEISALEGSMARRQTEIEAFQAGEQTAEITKQIADLTALQETETAALEARRTRQTEKEAEKKALEQTAYDVKQRTLTIESLQSSISGLDTEYALQSEYAQKGLEKLQATREKSFLYAPSDGVVAAASVSQVGDTVAAEADVMILAHPESLYLRYDGSNNLASLKAPASAVLHGVETELERIPYTSAELRRYAAAGETPHARYKILNEEITASPGDYAQLRLCTMEKENVLCVPVNALCTLDDTDSGYVFLEKDGKKVYTPVTYGMLTDAWAEITEGLSEGDTVYVQ